MRISGVMLPPLDKVTSDGYDLQFGTNALGLSIPLLHSALLMFVYT
jgi:hypothetical protein